MEDLLERLRLLDEKIAYAEKRYKKAILEEQPLEVQKGLKVRLNSLKKERSLYYYPLKKLKPTTDPYDYWFKKLESIGQFNQYIQR